MKMPCIRNLERFKKSGCPQKIWDGKEGCPCWIEMPVANRENPQKKEIRRNCIDLWQFDFQWAILGLLEGNQQAVESFRNGMIQTGIDGKDYPKSDPANLTLLNLFKGLMEKQEIIFEHKMKKQLKNENG